jgi:hypothetical protein
VAVNRSTIAYIGPEDKRVTGYQQAPLEKHIPADERLMAFAIVSHSGHECGDR